MAKKAKHPVQPLVLGDDGRTMFKKNRIIRYLLDAGSIKLDDLTKLDFDDEDWTQLRQLLGCSLDAFQYFNHVDDDTYERAAKQKVHKT